MPEIINTEDDTAPTKVAKPLVDAIRVGGTRYEIPTLALVAILFAILAPTVIYSTNLRDPTPAELLVAICIAMFSGVLSLWLLDVTGIFPFRSGWVSKSIWGTAIASILGTSVGVYQNAFSDHAYPLEGMWELSIYRGLEGVLLDRRNVMLMYSRNSDAYWGYSDARNLAARLPAPRFEEKSELVDTERVILWVEVDRLDLTTKQLDLTMYSDSGKESVRVISMNITPRRTVISGSSGSGQTVGDYHVDLSRPK